MSFKYLIVFLEGDDDERFFNQIIFKKIKEKYHDIKIWKYANIKYGKTDNFIKSVVSMGADYIFFADFNDALCISEKKEKLKQKFPHVNDNFIIIVRMEIESWYLSGASDRFVKRYNFNIISTDDVTKEDFELII